MADLTYIWTSEGWLYAAAVIDLFTRRVVGWSMSDTMTAHLVTDALVKAIRRRGKPDALLHHSDQSSQYTSEQFQRLTLPPANSLICLSSPVVLRSGQLAKQWRVDAGFCLIQPTSKLDSYSPRQRESWTASHSS